MSEIMLFPLASVILPAGKMRLRIFEPRYKRLVAQASQYNHSFGICLFERHNATNSKLSTIGTLVRIVDFSTLEDGLLGITVVGVKRFAIKQVRVEYDGLRFAQVEWLTHWPDELLAPQYHYLSTQLQKLYREFPIIGELYDQCFFDDGCWVSQRWLELLPLPNQQFDYLAGQADCAEALLFLDRAIETEKKLY